MRAASSFTRPRLSTMSRTVLCWYGSKRLDCSRCAGTSMPGEPQSRFFNPSNCAKWCTKVAEGSTLYLDNLLMRPTAVEVLFISCNSDIAIPALIPSAVTLHPAY